MSSKNDGAAAEAMFMEWLTEAEAAFLYIDQTPETFAPDFAGNTKRPDFLIAVPALGTIAVDVKDKTAKADHFYFDVEEQERMDEFEFAWRMPVWYVIMGPRSKRAYLIPNRVLASCDRATTSAGDAFVIHFDAITRCDPEKTTFYEALYSATCIQK